MLIRISLLALAVLALSCTTAQPALIVGERSFSAHELEGSTLSDAQLRNNIAFRRNAPSESSTISNERLVADFAYDSVYMKYVPMEVLALSESELKSTVDCRKLSSNAEFGPWYLREYKINRYLFERFGGKVFVDFFSVPYAFEADRALFDLALAEGFIRLSPPSRLKKIIKLLPFNERVMDVTYSTFPENPACGRLDGLTKVH